MMEPETTGVAMPGTLGQRGDPAQEETKMTTPIEFQMLNKESARARAIAWLRAKTELGAFSELQSLDPGTRAVLDRVVSLMGEDLLAMTPGELPPHVGLRLAVCLITPRQAREWLNNNIDNNRPVRSTRVNMLVALMKRGLWIANGETVIISNTGKLVDGQHRLLAIEASQEPQWTAVAFGVPETAYATIDKGVSRTTGDTLSALSVKNASAIGGIVRRLCASEMGNPNSGRLRVTEHDVVERTLAELHKFESIFAVLSTKSTERVFGRTRSWPGAAYYIMQRSRPDKFGHFFDALITGGGLPAGSPTLLLRDRLMAATATTRTSAKENPVVLEALCYKAFAMFCSGRVSIRSLKWMEAEPWPVTNGIIAGCGGGETGTDV